MTDQDKIDQMRDLINQHSKTIKQLVDMVNTLSARVHSLESLTAPQREQSDNFKETFIREILRGKNK